MGLALSPRAGVCLAVLRARLARTRLLSRCPPRPAYPGRCSSDPAPAPLFRARSPYYITPPARYARGARRGRRRYCPTSPPHYAIGCDGQFRPNLASPRLARAPFLSAPAHIVNAAPLQSYPSLRARAADNDNRHSRVGGNPAPVDEAAPRLRSTLSRRVRGVLSPYRERGNSALRAADGAQPRLP